MKLEDYVGEREDYEVRDEYLVQNREDLKYKIGDTIRLIPIEKLMGCSMISEVTLDNNVLNIKFLEDVVFECPEHLYNTPRTIVSIGHQGSPYNYYYIVGDLGHEEASLWVDEWMVQPKVTNTQKMLKFARTNNGKS